LDLNFATGSGAHPAGYDPLTSPSRNWQGDVAKFEQALQQQVPNSPAEAQWIYILQDRDEPQDLRILKVGMSNRDLKNRIGSGGATGAYSSWAKHRQRLSVHLFRPQEVAAKLGLAVKPDYTKDELKAIEDNFREAIYKTGKYCLPEDHTDSDEWRTGKGSNILHTLKTNNTTKGPDGKYVVQPFKIPGLD
jgi:hypothetical protein